MDPTELYLEICRLAKGAEATYPAVAVVLHALAGSMGRQDAELELAGLCVEFSRQQIELFESMSRRFNATLN